MANTFAHLAVANRILSLMPDVVVCTEAFYLGAVAPDTISSKENCTRAEKIAVHLRTGIWDVEWLQEDKMAIFDGRAADFARRYIAEAGSGEERDFALGYLVHLLTDKCNHGTIRQQMIKEAAKMGIAEATAEFYGLILNDLDAMDCYILDNYPQVGATFRQLSHRKEDYPLPDMLEWEYIDASMEWWNNTYIPAIRRRSAKHLQPADIDRFIEYSSEAVVKELEGLCPELFA